MKQYYYINSTTHPSVYMSSPLIRYSSVGPLHRDHSSSITPPRMEGEGHRSRSIGQELGDGEYLNAHHRNEHQRFEEGIPRGAIAV